MLKILIWVASVDNRFLNDALKILERQHNGVEVVGVTSALPIVLNNERSEFLQRFSHEEVASDLRNEYDILLVVGAKELGMSKIISLARQLRLPEEKLLGDRIVCIPGFTLDKYRRLQRSRLSIVSMNCFGGFLSHTLGLPFRSPFVNMFLDEKNFLRLLQNFQALMEKNLLLKETKWQTDLKFYYPVVTLGNVVINMNHYRDFNEAVAKWNERKTRINRYNLFVTMYTADEKILRAFDELPYGKKVCFVPFKSDVDSAWQINSESQRGIELWGFINAFAQGKQFFYDPFDMLLYGKKTPLIEM